MKIALICTEKLPVPPVAGGAVQQYIEGIVPYLSKVHDITVFSISYPGLPKEETKNNVKYVRVSARNTNEYLNNLKLVLNRNFDLIHVYNRPLWVYELSQSFPRTKFSLSLHNEMFHREKISTIKASECINKSEFICTVSKFIADGVKNLYPLAENKLKVIYSGADVNTYKPIWTKEGSIFKQELKKKFHLQDYKVILFVGRFSPKKGTHILLKAVERVMNYRDDVALAVIGSKWYGENKSDDYTRMLKKLGENLTGPVVFTGFLPPSEIPHYFNLGDIFVCPSQWSEPLARVHYEAMAAGLPIITTNRGGNAEVISGFGNGFVIDDYKNPDSFAASINNLLKNPSKALEMGKIGRGLVEERYNYERVAKDLLQSFNEIKIKK